MHGIEAHISDLHAIAALNDMTIRGAAELVLRDDGAVLMIIHNNATEDVLFKITPTGLRCLARLKPDGNQDSVAGLTSPAGIKNRKMLGEYVNSVVIRWCFLKQLT